MPPPYQYQPAPPLSDSDQRLWATLIHVGGVFFWIWPSLIGYLVAKDRGAFIREHARQALNFHITMAIAVLIGFLLTIILVGFLIIAAIAVVILIFSILAAVAANNGQLFRYPLSYEFIK
ncbi:MAG: hypothetical protein JWQ39_2414 [Glaciihabitans sp.]|jgi:uncharacterized Tic20 family protein|nr:hypothetical protein [Glaciihabitans sp.]